MSRENGATPNFSYLDRAQWKLDRNFIRGAVLLDAPADLARLGQRISELADAHPRLRARLARTGTRCLPVIAAGDRAAQLEWLELSEARSTSDILDHLGSLQLSVDDADGRLWRWVHVCAPNCPDAPAALLVCWHHALADGRTGLAIIQALMDERGVTLPQAAHRDARPWWRPAASTVSALAWLATSTRGLLTASAKPYLEGPRKVETASRTFDRAFLRGRAADWNCSQDIAVLTIAARLYGSEQERENNGSGGPLRLLVPITIQPSIGRLPIGNYFMPAIVNVTPTANSPTVLAAAIAATLKKQAKQQMNPFGLATFERYLAFDDWISPHLPPGVYDRIRWGYLERLSGVCTLIPGPHRPFTVGGSRALELHGFAPVLSGTRFSFTAITYNGGVTVSLTGHPERILDLPALLDRIDGGGR